MDKDSAFTTLLNHPQPSLCQIQKLCWNGIPSKQRAAYWLLLLGISPLSKSKRSSVLSRRRQEYNRISTQFFSTSKNSKETHLTSAMRLVLSQIRKDVPRTAPSHPLFKHQGVQDSLERVLFLWAVRNPAAGYVQGINDLLTPFFLVFLESLLDTPSDTYTCGNSHICSTNAMGGDSHMDNSISIGMGGINAMNGTGHMDNSISIGMGGINAMAASNHMNSSIGMGDNTNTNATDNVNNPNGIITDDILRQVEADSFWCLSKLLQSVQENYIFAQPGIQRLIYSFEELVQRVDSELAEHLHREGLLFLQFAFRWMNCFLMRELPLRLSLRLFDTYLSEEEGFKDFHVYLCTSFLLFFRDKLLQLEFADLVLFIQHLPTDRWTEKEMSSLLAQAFVYQSLFQGAPHHLR